MTVESLGTGLIVVGFVFALLGLPLIIGARRLGASHKRLLEYAAQLRTRSSLGVVTPATFDNRGETLDPGLTTRLRFERRLLRS